MMKNYHACGMISRALLKVQHGILETIKKNCMHDNNII